MTAPPSQILIVEDSETQALKMQALLSEAGFEVHRAATAEDAMAHLGRQWPDMVVVDYHLPKMSGAEFCRRLRTLSGVEAIPVLMLTDDAEARTEEKGLESGADDHLRKSAGDDVLLARIEALLRVAPTRASMTAISAEPSRRFRARNILLIDDSPTFLVALGEALKDEGLTVHAVDDPSAALDWVERHRIAGTVDQIDCVVVDQIMPEISGVEVCRRLNEIRREEHTALPIVMCTSQDSNADMMRALEAGADDFVAKSNDMALLIARIRAHLRRKSLHDEHERILNEFRSKELELVEARAEQKAALARAELVEELERAHADLKRTHTQLVQSAKMAGLGELVAGVAHEINNPLAYSLAHAQTVSRVLDAVSDDPETRLSEGGARKLGKGRLRIGEAIGGLERVADLIQKLRTFSRLDEGEFKEADLRECVEATLPLVRHRTGKGVRLVTEFATDNVIYCAPGTLNQVILNLLVNALDAVNDDGEIRVRTEREDAWFRLSVTDSGPGIAEEAKDRLFEPFFTTKTVGEGTGLGLAISYQIVESHQGRIEACNAPEGGAAFTIVIPTNLAERSHGTRR